MPVAKVLLVDDAQTVREAIAIVLRLDGHDVIGCACADDALKALARTSVDLVIVDLSMPKMDGVEFLRALRAIPACGKLPVILLTGAPHPEQIRRCQDLGILAALTKGSFAISELSALISSATGPNPVHVA
jgi:two-component system chemotaxis response regulator CheY